MMNDTLQHHGILGQKWGKRNGPPYPLDENDHSISEKKAQNQNEHRGLSDKQKKALIITSATVAAALAVGGGIMIYKSTKGKNVFHNIPKSKTLEEVINQINKHKGNMNCGNCGIALEMAMRGKDVCAMDNPNGMTMSELGRYFNLKQGSIIDHGITNMDLFDLKTGSYITDGKKVESILQKQIIESFDGDARGMTFVPMKLGSHWISWVKEGNEVVFVNSQNMSVDLTKECFNNLQYYRNSTDATLSSFRLDNAEVNLSTIGEVIQNVTSEIKTQTEYGIKGNNFKLIENNAIMGVMNTRVIPANNFKRHDKYIY